MARLCLLGTGAAVSDAHRTTTMLAFESGQSVVVVDCGGDVIQRLMLCGVPLDHVDTLILTHAHPDHLSGFPLFMEKIWIAGRRRPIRVCGLKPAMDQARRLFETFDLTGWDGLPDIEWSEVAPEEKAHVFENGAWRITASPGAHGVPVIGLRVEDRAGGGVVAYSCDTERSEAIARLAGGAGILLHEATGAYPGHSTMADAAAVAAGAGAKRLLLVHLPPAAMSSTGELNAAREIFPWIEKGVELGIYDF